VNPFFCDVRMPSMKLIVPLTLLFAAQALAWGPVTHQVFGCRLAGDGSDVCFTTAKGRSLVLGSSAPDAFKLFLPGGNPLHSSDFAAFQLRFAERDPAGTTPSFDAIAYSHGFGAHIAQDSVGHRKDGYLPGNVSAHNDHLREAVADTFTAETFPGGYESQRFSAFGDGTISFCTAVIQAYGKQKGNEKLANVSHQAVAEAMRSFDSLEFWEQIAIAANVLYRSEMVALDPYKPSDFAEARANFERVASCSQEASLAWIESISIPETTGLAAQKAVAEKVKTLFAEGRCQPGDKENASEKASP